MRLALRMILFVTICVLAISSMGWAEVINFNNLPGDGSTVPNGYDGFNWYNFYDMTMKGILDPSPTLPPDGSPPIGNQKFAFDHAGSASAFSSETGTFSFQSAWFETMLTTPTTLEVEGVLNGAVVGSKFIVLTSGAPQLLTFDWSGINEVRFTPITPAANTLGSGQFLMTNVVINASTPEPSSLLLLGSSLVFAVTKIRKRRSLT
jgi:PEP-CTERM motif